MMAVLKDPEDATTMSLIFANQTEDDILLKAEIDDLQNNHPNRLKVSLMLPAAAEDSSLTVTVL